MAHACGGCGRYVAVVNGRAMDYARDGFTPSERPHHCGPNGLLHVVRDGEPCRFCAPSANRTPPGMPTGADDA